MPLSGDDLRCRHIPPALCDLVSRYCPQYHQCSSLGAAQRGADVGNGWCQVVAGLVILFAIGLVSVLQRTEAMMGCGEDYRWLDQMAASAVG